VSSQIRFGVVSESVLDGPAWADHARRVEDAGVSSLLIRDHFSAGAFGQQLAPFSALAAAAAVTARLRVGTMVARPRSSPACDTGGAAAWQG
jgi:alkanesulfonate monooxygenase SsuD/methylene tetrahydromethanopterin reductase-like flavin-dependent oxidoreductase (luciferase family)